MTVQTDPTRLSYPRLPDGHVLEMAKEIVGKRFETDHNDYNRLLQGLRERGLDHQLGFYGQDAASARPVVDYVAEQNLQEAPVKALQRRIDTLERQINRSISNSLSRIDISRLGGRGAAGRVRDQANDAFRRDITKGLKARLEAEVHRRALLSAGD